MAKSPSRTRYRCPRVPTTATFSRESILQGPYANSCARAHVRYHVRHMRNVSCVTYYAVKINKRRELYAVNGGTVINPKRWCWLYFIFYISWLYFRIFIIFSFISLSFISIYLSLHNYGSQVYIWHCSVDILNVFHGGSCLINLFHRTSDDDVKGQVSDARDVVIRNQESL